MATGTRIPRPGVQDHCHYYGRLTGRLQDSMTSVRQTERIQGLKTLSESESQACPQALNSPCTADGTSQFQPVIFIHRAAYLILSGTRSGDCVKGPLPCYAGGTFDTICSWYICPLPQDTGQGANDPTGDLRPTVESNLRSLPRITRISLIFLFVSIRVIRGRILEHFPGHLKNFPRRLRTLSFSKRSAVRAIF